MSNSEELFDRAEKYRRLSQDLNEQAGLIEDNVAEIIYQRNIHEKNKKLDWT